MITTVDGETQSTGQIEKYEIETIVVGMPFLLNGDKAERAKKTEKFIQQEWE